MGGLWGFWVIFDRESVVDDFRLAFLKGAVQIQGSVCQCNTVSDGREVIHLCRQFQHVYHIGDLLGKVRSDVFTHHLENLTPQGHGVHHSAIRGEKCAIRVKQLVGAQKIVTEQGFVEKALLEPCGGKITHRHSVLSLALRKTMCSLFFSATGESTSCRSPCMAFLPPSGGVFRLSFSGSSPGIPFRRSCGFQGATGKTATKKPSQNRPALPSLFLEGHASRLCNG